MQYGGGRHIADLRELREDRLLQRATGFKVIPSDFATLRLVIEERKRKRYRGDG